MYCVVAIEWERDGFVARNGCYYVCNVDSGKEAEKLILNIKDEYNRCIQRVEKCSEFTTWFYKRKESGLSTKTIYYCWYKFKKIFGF